MAFNTDTERMLESASRLEGIRDEVLSSLGLTAAELLAGLLPGQPIRRVASPKAGAY